jgi:hypothetical protein
VRDSELVEEEESPSTSFNIRNNGSTKETKKKGIERKNPDKDRSEKAD